MKQTITKQEAHDLLKKYIETPHVIDHSYESAVVMQKLAKQFNEDEDKWYIVGLLHDLDLDILEGDYRTHGETTKKILEDEGYILPDIIKPILSHTECLEEMNKKYYREEKIDYALAAAEQITGIITAYARMRPEKFEGMKPKSLNKKLKDKAFAASVNRQFIEDIEKTGLSKNEFLQIAINAISEISDEINI